MRGQGDKDPAVRPEEEGTRQPEEENLDGRTISGEGVHCKWVNCLLEACSGHSLQKNTRAWLVWGLVATSS